MKLLCLDAPTEPKDLRLWLEIQLVGFGLGQLVQELAVIHHAPLDGPPDCHGDSVDPPIGGSVEFGKPTPRLVEALQNDLPRVLQEGLRHLSQPALQRLMTQPQLLLDLQEQVFIQGGAYWSQLPPDPEVSVTSDRVLRALCADEAFRELTGVVEPPPRSKPRPAKPRRGTSWRIVLAIAVAAAMVAGVWFRPLLFPAPGPQVVASAPRGWSKPGVLDVDLPEREFFVHLSDLAVDYDDIESLESKAALIQRLKEFEMGCRTLIAASKLQIQDNGKRAELNKKCSSWRKTASGLLLQLEQGAEGDDRAKIRTLASDMVKKLIKTLKDPDQFVRFEPGRGQGALAWTGELPLERDATGAAGTGRRWPAS